MAIHTLLPGASLEHRKDDAGNILIAVTIPPGQPGEGNYLAVGAALSEIALEAIGLLNEPGCSVDVGVNATVLQSVAVRMTL